MIRLINRETYLLPNNEIVQAVWRPESKIWVLYQSETERFWLVTRRGRIFHMRYGLNLAGYQDDLVDTGWNTSELALFEEPDISIMQAAQIQEVKPLYPHRLRNEPNPVRPYFGRAARRLIRALIFLQLVIFSIFPVLIIAVVVLEQPDLAHELSLPRLFHGTRLIIPQQAPQPETLPVLPAIDYAVQPGIRVQAQVLEVIDGSTIVVELHGQQQRVRYYGIETSDPNSPLEAEARNGALAWSANRDYVEGKQVLLEVDVSEADRAGNLMRYVWVDDDMINAELIQQGLATVRIIPPDIKYQMLFEMLQVEARKAGRQIWGATQ